MEARGAHALFLRELRPGQTHLTHEPSRAVDRQTHEDHSLNRRQEPGHATSSHRLALSSRYCGSPGFGRLCRYPARFGSGPNHGATALDLPKALGRTWQSRSAKSIGRRPMNDPEQSKALVTTEIRVPATLDPAAGSANPFGRAIVVPHVVAHAGDRAKRRFANFFGSIENDNNRAAYQRACALIRRLSRAAGPTSVAVGNSPRPASRRLRRPGRLRVRGERARRAKIAAFRLNGEDARSRSPWK